MPIVFETGGALNQALGNLGTSLGGALGQASRARTQQQQSSQLSKVLSEGGLSEENLLQLAQSPQGQQILKSLAPVIKEQARTRGASDFLSQALGIPSQGQQQRPQASQSRPAPIEEETVSESVTEEVSEPGQPAIKFSELSDEQIAVLAGSPFQQHRDLAQTLSRQKQQKEAGALQQQKLAQSARQFSDKQGFERNKPLFEDVRKSRAANIDRKIALERIEEATLSGDMNRLRDYGADRLGLDPLKTTAAQVMESAVKELFLADLKSIQGGRINQLLEANLLKSLQNVGKSAEANQEITETIIAASDIIDKRNEIFDEIETKYDDLGIGVPKNFDKLIEDQLKPFANEKLKELSATRKDLKAGNIKSSSALKMRKAIRETEDVAPEFGNVWMIAPNGQVRQIPINQINKATAAGGKVVNGK